LIELTAGDHAAAIEVLEATGRFSLERGVREPNVALWAQDLCESYIRTGQATDAEATLEALEARVAASQSTPAGAGAARCRGLLADDDGFEAHFARALALHADPQSTCPFEHARTLLCLGERRRRARRRIEARAPLRAAIATFDALGAVPWADRARTELRATGERARFRRPDTADQLTPHEFQVAMLVADGATNREVAAALFVSPRTIETHLHRAFRKLGVRSRVELARELRGGNA
jgi:DNA-binding CsgD family transcriptional regulator